MVEYRQDMWYYNNNKILNIEKIFLRFKPVKKIKMYTKNKNFEMLGVVKIAAKLGIKTTHKVYEWQICFVECHIFELRLQLFKEVVETTDPYLKKIKLGGVCTIQGVCELIKRDFFKKNMVGLAWPRELYVLKSFVGGRVETFTAHANYEVVVDFNMFYLNLMLQKLPFGSGYFIKNPTNYLKPGFYQAEVDQSSVQPPFLPCKQDNKITYPNKKFSGIFWFEELEKFEKLGGKILQIFDCLLFKKYESFLGDFLISISSNCSKELTKTIANRLFGSFIIKNWEYTQHLILDNCLLFDLVELGGARSFKVLNGGCLIEQRTPSTKSNKNLINSAAAAAITSKGRVKLYELWGEVGFDEVGEIRVDELRIKKKLGADRLDYLVKKYNLKVL